MKRRFLLMMLLLALPLGLGGCALYPERLHGVERLLVVQAMGLDYSGDALRLSLCSAADSARGEGPVRLSGSGLTIRDAADDVARRVTDEELFCAHTGQLLIGEESARRGIGDVLRYVCRSRELRMDLPLYVVREGSAEEALLGTGDERSGAVEVLEMLAASAPAREGGEAPSVSRIAGTLEEGGCALVAALRCVPASEQQEDGALLTLAPAGCGVIRDGRLVAFLDEEDMAGLDLLTGARGVHTLLVRDRNGRRVTLRTAPGKTSLRALRDGDGALTGLELTVTLPVSVSEIDGRGALSDAAYADALTAAAEREILRRAGRVVGLEKSLGADFLGLKERLALLSTAGERERDAALLAAPGELEIRLAAGVTIQHANDLR